MLVQARKLGRDARHNSPAAEFAAVFEKVNGDGRARVDDNLAFSRMRGAAIQAVGESVGPERGCVVVGDFDRKARRVFEPDRRIAAGLGDGAGNGAAADCDNRAHHNGKGHCAADCGSQILERAAETPDRVLSGEHVGPQAGKLAAVDHSCMRVGVADVNCKNEGICHTTKIYGDVPAVTAGLGTVLVQ